MARLFTGGAAVLIVVTVLAGAIGVWSTLTSLRAIERTSLTSQVIRDHMLADMMHEALLGDVYRALHAAENAPGARPEIEADLDRHIQTFNEAIARNQERALPPALHDAYAQLAEPLAAYAKAASALVERASHDGRAPSFHLEAFDRAFARLETGLEAVSELAEAEVAAAEADAGRIAALALPVAIGSALLTLVGVAVMLTLLIVKLLRPLGAMTVVLNRLGTGDLSPDVPGQGRPDEIGAMAAAITSLRDHAREAERLRHQQHALDAAAEARQREALLQLAHEVETVVRHSSDIIAASITRLANDQGGGAADRALAQARASGEAAQQLDASIREIAERAAATSAVVGGAVEVGRGAEARIRELAEAVGAIGSFADTISGIAARTQMLALNASIEAARAGDAGRGFAVVAQEVKALAIQAAGSTEAIRRQVEALAGATTAAVEAVTGMSGEVARIDEMAGAIAAAVEQQGAVSREIAQGAVDASGSAEAVQEVARVVAREVDAMTTALVRTTRTSLEGTDRRSGERQAWNRPARLVQPGPERTVQVENLSTNGARITGEHGLDGARRGALVLRDGGPAIAFEVAQIDRGGASLAFTTPLTPAEQERLGLVAAAA
jgi:methyl-accepting chemotaxis protein